MQRKLLALFIATALLAVAGACGGDSNNEGSSGTDSSAQKGGEPKPGGKYSFAPLIDVSSLDPAKWAGTTGSIFSARGQAIYEALVVLDDKTNKATPRMLESITSDDGVTWTLKVRPNIKFTDGTALDAAAIKSAWERIADPKLASLSQTQAAAVASMDTPDPSTLVVKLKSADGQFPETIAGSSGLTYVPSPAAVAKFGADYGSSADKTVGAGPFIPKEWVRDSRLHLTKNPGYYDKVYLDELDIVTILDPTQALNTLKTSGVDTIVAIDPRVMNDAKSAGLRIASWTPNGGRGLAFNTTKAPFNDPLARKALAYAFDPEAATKALYGGAVEVAKGPFDKGSPYADDSIKWPQADQAQAQKLLDEYAAKNGKPLSFTLMAPKVGLFTDDAEWFQARLKSFKNVEVKYDTVPGGPPLQERLRSGNFEAWLFAHSFGDPNTLAQAVASDGPLNFYTNYKSAEVSALVAEDKRTLKEADRVEIWQKIERKLAEDVPFVFELRQPFYNLMNASIRGADTGETVMGGTPDFRRVYLDK